MQTKMDADKWSPSFQATASEPEAQVSLVRRIGVLRDGLIVLATGIYLLGYASWALYAWTNGLGPIPALDAQYFAAGMFPSLVIAISFLGVRILIEIARRFSSDLTVGQKRAGKVFGQIGMGLMFAGVIAHLLRLEGRMRSLEYLPYGAAVFIYAAAFLSRDKRDKFLRWLGLGALWFFLFIGSLLLFAQYVVGWFPHVPQEFGGPSPRLVEFDLKTEELSRPTAEQLLPEGQPGEAKGTRRSLLFDGGDLVLIKREPGPVSASNPAHRLRKSAVTGVFPRDQASQ